MEVIQGFHTMVVAVGAEVMTVVLQMGPVRLLLIKELIWVAEVGPEAEQMMELQILKTALPEAMVLVLYLFQPMLLLFLP